jgi:hypothetical protein
MLFSLGRACFCSRNYARSYRQCLASLRYHPSTSPLLFTRYPTAAGDPDLDLITAGLYDTPFPFAHVADFQLTSSFAAMLRSCHPFVFAHVHDLWKFDSTSARQCIDPIVRMLTLLFFKDIRRDSTASFARWTLIDVDRSLVHCIMTRARQTSRCSYVLRHRSRNR